MAAPRILVIPGGTAINAVALANASIHKLVELYEERQADPNHPAPHTVVFLRDPALVPPATLRGSAATPEQAFPEEDYPGLADRITNDPHFLDGVDLVIATSGSSVGKPRLVGLSTDALIASAKATELALDGPGRWILALPTHHIAGAMVLLRAAVAETNPQVVDTTQGFDPAALLPAIAGVTQDQMPGYLSLVPTQLVQCLDAGDQVIDALRSLSAILVGGAAISQNLLQRALDAGLKVRTTYGMTETSGGCVYDGEPDDALPGSGEPLLRGGRPPLAGLGRHGHHPGLGQGGSERPRGRRHHLGRPVDRAGAPAPRGALLRGHFGRVDPGHSR